MTERIFESYRQHESGGDPGRGAGRIDGGVRTFEPGNRLRGPGAGCGRGWTGSHRGAQRLPIRHRGPPLLHESFVGEADLARVLGDDLLTRQRLSRIYYKSDSSTILLSHSTPCEDSGVLETFRCGLEFLRAVGYFQRSARATISQLGFQTGSAGACSRLSSRATRKKCGAWIAAKSARSGPPSAFRSCPWVR